MSPLFSVDGVSIVLLSFLKDFLGVCINFFLYFFLVDCGEAAFAPEEDGCQEESEVYNDVYKKPPVLVWCFRSALWVSIEDDLHVDEDSYFIEEKENDADTSAEDFFKVSKIAHSFDDVGSVHGKHQP